MFHLKKLKSIFIDMTFPNYEIMFFNKIIWLLKLIGRKCVNFNAAFDLKLYKCTFFTVNRPTCFSTFSQ